jgi:phytoene dehydrogenase-like protein
LEFARGIERRYRELGGNIFYKSKVEEIIVSNNRATGIRLSDGSVHTADYVVSAADGYETIFKLLKGQYIDAEINALYDSKKVSQPSIQVSLGINCDLSRYPYCNNIILEDPVQIGGHDISNIMIKHFCYDKILCPPNKSVVTSLISADYPYWEKLYENRELYKAEKERIAGWFTGFLENRYPEVKDKIEVVDVATPMTYNRYTEVWQGAYSGWSYPTQKIPNVLPGLDGFYLAGQWTKTTGGLPTAALTGKGSIMRVCKEDGKEFVSSAC